MQWSSCCALIVTVAPYEPSSPRSRCKQKMLGKTWIENYDHDTPGPPILEPNISPSLDRLVQLVKALREVHPELETFWFDFGTTQTEFWNFRYPAPAEAMRHGAVAGDADEGMTTTCDVNDGKIASFTFWQGNVEGSVGWK